MSIITSISQPAASPTQQTNSERSNPTDRKVQSVFKSLCLGPSNDALSFAGTANGSYSLTENLVQQIHSAATPEISKTNQGAFTIGSSVNGVLFAIQNIFKGIIFANEGANSNDGARLGVGAIRIVRGVVDLSRNSANLASGAVMLSKQAESLQGVLGKIALGSSVGLGVSGLIISATGITSAREAFLEAKEFEDIYAKVKDNNYSDVITHLKGKLELSAKDKTELKKEIEGTDTGVLSRLARYAKEGLRQVFGDKKTDFILLCREVIRGDVDLDDKVQAKLNALKDQIEDKSGSYNSDLPVITTKLGDYAELYRKLEIEQLKLKKDNIFDRVFGKDVRDKLHRDKLHQVTANHSENHSEIAALAKKNVTSNKRIFIAMGIIAAFAAVVSVAFAALDYVGTFAGIPIMKIVETSIMLLSTLLVLGMDLIALLKSTANTTNKANKIAAIGTLIWSWLTQSALLVAFKLSMVKAQVLVPLAIMGAGIGYLISKIYKAKTDGQHSKDSDLGEGDKTPSTSMRSESTTSSAPQDSKDSGLGEGDRTSTTSIGSEFTTPSASEHKATA